MPLPLRRPRVIHNQHRGTESPTPKTAQRDITRNIMDDTRGDMACNMTRNMRGDAVCDPPLHVDVYIRRCMCQHVG